MKTPPVLFVVSALLLSSICVTGCGQALPNTEYASGVTHTSAPGPVSVPVSPPETTGNTNNMVTSSGNTTTVTPSNFSFSSATSWGNMLVGGAWANADANIRLVVDIDGDKRADILATNQNTIFLAKAQTASFATPVTLRDDYLSSAGWTSQDATPRILGDIDGDGKGDIVGMGFSNLFVDLYTGVDMAGSTTFVGTDFTRDAGYVSMATSPRFLADVDGDGRADLIGINAAGVHVSLSTGTTFMTSTLWSSGFAAGWPSQDATPRMMADVDGDGKFDIVGFGTAGVVVGYSTGSAFTTSTVSQEFCGSSWASNVNTPRFVGDVDGDGKADLVGIDADGVHVAIGLGTAFRPSAVAFVGFDAAAGFSDQGLAPRFLADVNGDSKADLVGFSATEIDVALAP